MEDHEDDVSPFSVLVFLLVLIGVPVAVLSVVAVALKRVTTVIAEFGFPARFIMAGAGCTLWLYWPQIKQWWELPQER